MSPDLNQALIESAGRAEDLPDLDAISQRSRAIVRRRWVGRAIAATALVAAIVIAGTSWNFELATPPEPAHPPRPEAPALEAGKALPPGRYRATTFDPPFEFAVPSDGWFSGVTTPAWTYLTKDDVHLHVQRWGRAFDPAAATVAPTAFRSIPNELASWLTEHPRLMVTGQTVTDVGGLTATRLDARVARPIETPPSECEGTPCVVIARLEGHREVVDIQKGETARFYVVASPSGPIVIHWRATSRRFDATAALMDRLISSIDFVAE